MNINASIKYMRTVILPQNPSPVALLFKDAGGLANHPLSCHPQGVFGSRENKRKIKKMKEKENNMKAYRPVLYISNQAKKIDPLGYKGLSLYKALIRKIQKYPQFTLIHMKGKNGKKGVKMTKSKQYRRKFRTGVRNCSCFFALLMLLFCSSFPFDL